MVLRRLVKQLLTNRRSRAYERELAVRKMTYADWVAVQEEALDRRLEDSQAAGGRCAGEEAELVIFCCPPGHMDERAKEWLSLFFREQPEALIVYGHEDVRGEDGSRQKPWWKPGWSPDTFLSYCYIGSLLAVRAGWLKTLSENVRGLLQEAASAAEQAGGAEVLFVKDRLHYAALAAALLQEAGGFERGCKRIFCFPGVLFHYDSEAQMELWQQCCPPRQELPARLTEEARVSVVIPSRDHPEVLQQCLKALLRTAGSELCEVIVVDNGSNEANTAQTRALLEELFGGPESRIAYSYLYEPMEFNFSRMCNLGAGKATGNLLLFLNDDVEAASFGWLAAMAGKALQPFTGAVGLKLYYPDSIRIQHDGITALPMGPVHKLQFLEDSRSFDFGRNRFDYNVLAVTAACLMVRKERFLEAGGYREELRVAFNDVSLCYRLWELGWSNVVVNSHFAYHHESLSRGEDESAEKLKRLMGELALLRTLHPEIGAGYDPYYPDGLNRDCLDTGIRPACETAGNRPQAPDFQEKEINLSAYRRDNCLLFRIERCDREEISGYCVVLGDDNACYEKELILIPGEEKAEGAFPGYLLPLTGQYRPDLQENMTDQRNVALCGFRIQLKGAALKPGIYQVGAVARGTVSHTRLWNLSNRFFLWEETEG